MAARGKVRKRRKVTRIVALRLLPPMGIARFGSSKEPMVNYWLDDPPEDNPDYFRNIKPATTLVIDKDSGRISEICFPKEAVAIRPDGSVDRKQAKPIVKFRDDQGLIKPVCPFFEVWAQVEAKGPFRPLTLHDLRDLGLKAGDIKWRASATNSKAARRTGESSDSVKAHIGLFANHRAHELKGMSLNFKAGKFISFGHMRYIKPEISGHQDIDEITSVIRVRFTPGAGKIFGPRKNDPYTHDDVYWARDAGGGKTANWNRYYPDDPNSKMPVTAPQDIFQGWMMGLAESDEDWGKLSAGYFDDTCDGIIEVRLTHRGAEHKAYARFASAVPDFAPDCLPARSIADDLEQLVLGPCEVQPRNLAAHALHRAKVVDILRRSLDTVRQMNTAVANGTQPIGGVRENWQSMSRRLHTNYEATYTEVFPHDPRAHADSHRQMFSYSNALRMHRQQLVKALNDGSTAAFYVMRMPEDAGDVWPTSRMQMPAFMRGSEGMELCLTRRQLSVLAIAAGEDPEVVLSCAARNAARAAAAARDAAPGGDAINPKNKTALNHHQQLQISAVGEQNSIVSFDPKNRTALQKQLHYRGVGNPPASHPATAVGNFFPGLEFNFLNVWKRIFCGLHLLESSGYVIEFLPNEARGHDREELKKLERLKKSRGRKHDIYLVKVEYDYRSAKRKTPKMNTVDVLSYARGPAFDSEPEDPDPTRNNSMFMEWGNALAHMHSSIVAPRKAECYFLVGTMDEDTKEWSWKERGPIKLEVRRLIQKDQAGETALISPKTSEPGDITESLCSPWQTDYVGCACFYWASNRPDFVNAEAVEVKGTNFKNEPIGEPDFHIRGQHWLDVPLDKNGNVKRDISKHEPIPRLKRKVTLKNGKQAPKPFYTIERKFNKKGKLLKHEDVLKSWEDKFEFIIKGQDAPDGVASGKPDKPLKLDRDHVGIGMQGAARVQDAGALAGLSRRAGRARK